jgi:hypothetical protein
MISAGTSTGEQACVLGTSVSGYVYSYASEGTTPANGIIIYNNKTENTLSGIPTFLPPGQMTSYQVILWNGGTKYAYKLDAAGQINLLHECGT